MNVSICITAPASAAEALSERLLELGAESVSLRPGSFGGAGEEVLEPPPQATPLWAEVCVAGLFPLTVDVARVVAELTADMDIEIDAIDWLGPQDWSQTWRSQASTLTFGERLMVMPRKAPPPQGFAGAIVCLDPGLAFGTGAHPTTRLCLAWLAAVDLAGAAVLDYGSGSGILAIAAALLGAKPVVAVDQDPQARTATERNAACNNVVVDAVLAPQDLPQGGDFHVVVANILAKPLISLASRLTSALRPNGHLVLSGLLAEQAEAVAAAYPGVGFRAPAEEDGWVRMVGQKRSG